eukprot:CFRG0212T1
MGDLLPISAFTELKLTTSKLPVTLDNEIVLCMQGGVALYNNDDKTPYPEGSARVTSHRVLFTGPHTSLSLPLSDIRTLDIVKKFLRQSPKVVMHMNMPFSGFLKLSFRNGGHEDFYQQLQLALVKRAWLAPPPPKAGSQNESIRKGNPTLPAVGIAGIQRRKEEQREQVDEVLTEAFKDLQSLSVQAKDMVELAQKLQAKLSKAAPSEDENMKFKSYLLSLGIVTPVTKDMAGSELGYFEDLARELSDFLQQPLVDAGGTLPMASVYCMYNRARGSDLISPDDLIRACKSLKNLRLPIVMRTFPSGVNVIQLETESDDGVIEKICEMFYCTKSLRSNNKWVAMSAADFAGRRGIAIPLAREQLLTGERNGVLCRDDTLEGLKFYPNLISAPGS